MSRNSRIALIAALVAVAAGTFIVLKPTDDDGTPATPAGGTAATSTAATTTAETPPKARPMVIRIKDGRPVGGVRELTVRQGDRIRFTVTADEPQHVHLHGYDVEKAVGPGAPAAYSVPATINGVFEIEIEDTSTQIAKLTVNP